ncbi:Lsr2 family DNA-binding protein [Streptomyces sp. NPDC001107]
MSSIDDLTRLSPPPVAPPAVDWTAVESTLGRSLPQDYKELVAAYGPGSFCNFIHVYDPSGSLTGPLATSVQEQLQRDWDQGTYPVPYDPQHLLIAGATDNGNYLFWITEPESEPDAWRIAINEARGHEWYTFDGTLTDFLTAVLGGELQVPLFPQDVLYGGPTFTPSRRDSGTPLSVPVGRSVDTNSIREWARANGYDVPLRGRIPAAVRDAWEQATRGAE